MTKYVIGISIFGEFHHNTIFGKIDTRGQILKIIRKQYPTLIERKLLKISL